MHLVPKKFFVCSGAATSEISDLNAFDIALIRAGIGEQNMLSVSSVIPEGAEQIEPHALPMGGITHSVLAQMRGSEGEMISAGIAYAFRKDGKGGYVAEGHLHGSKDSLQEVLEWKMEEMAKHREIELDEIQYELREMKIPMDNYGACIASLIFVDY